MSDVKTVTICLPGSQDRVADTIFSQNLQRFQVHSRLRQPHSFRSMAKCLPKGFDAPAYLGNLIQPGGQRQNGVMEGLGHTVAHSKT
ncbi:hypothetical protein SDC9_156391 [bioreactor metagenome]|uniref:Uncharacterized protein n=1 Tax=bioreactor metagenome TaxID=1076179 RepID=A0A645F9G0_9ZZZZ